MGGEGEPRWAAFGRRLRYWRSRSGLTQAQLGSLLGYHHSHISKMERGFRGPPPRFPEAADELLRSGGELTALWERSSGASSPLLPYPVPAVDGQPARVTPELLANWPSSLPANGLPCPLHDTAGCAVPPPGHVLAPGRALPVDTDGVHGLAALLAAFEGMAVGRIRVDCAPVERTLRALVERSEQVAARSAPPLLRLAARYAQLAGWLRVLHDQHGLAMSWYGHGLRWADFSGDATAKVALLFDMAMVARIERDRDAVHSYAAALEQAAPGRRWVATMASLYRARGDALRGSLGDVERHIARARELLDGLGERDRAEAPWLVGPQGVMRLESSAAGALRDVAARAQDPRAAHRAVAASRAALCALPAHMRPTRTLLTLRLADAHACAGDPEAAVAAAYEVLDDALAAPRTTIVRELGGLQARLTADTDWAGTAAARHFQERLRATLPSP
ncbi:helix-turn-helix domain-containing protein [Streptomyces sp. JJ38]|uniref:helix-turn-helix domain-containing protein n=1 Tax=Streptomyces sp. JJ38 TaxID=2738128 RepID=UPI001C5676CF|nr:helix-turn-helix transcriptional regulator [Streptomyces sp. JJ38]MBW1597674.1 helix-turn-helix domain-containing protein [Streptomyces sp. JJ38]